MSKLVIFLWSSLFYTNCYANTVEVKVLGRDGVGLANVVVDLRSNISVKSAPTSEVAIMDQVNTQFLPHILVVQKDTFVRFPNSDSIKHHVYSFSSAKVFELQLYSGLRSNPLMFSKTGVVELGCNVHDWMLGYIYVVDSPYFAKTDSAGIVTLEVPAGHYQLNAWHPLIQDDVAELASNIEVNGNTEKTIRIPSELLPSLEQFEEPIGELTEYD
jgi:plastocyanin